MRRILITGADSYIGQALEMWLKKWPEEYRTDTVDMCSSAWREKDFSAFDAVFHVAGITHRKQTKRNRQLFYAVNRDLTYEVAEKAKSEGVRQFIFMSTMNVYGMETGVITGSTVPAPKQAYGMSKLLGEEKLRELEAEGFSVAVLRSPMVYGPGCKGNFRTLIRMVKLLPVFPDVENQRSMLFINHLCEFVKLVIDNEAGGVLFPQNREYVSTKELARTIGSALGKRVVFSRCLGTCVRLLMPFCPMARKAFGSLIYEDTEVFEFCYCVADEGKSFGDSVER